MATRRTQEQRIADIDAKIEYHKQHLDRLQKDREALLNPPERKTRARKTSMKTAMDALKEAGLTPDEIMTLAAKAKKKAKTEQ